jgi:hypothetical protein
MLTAHPSEQLQATARYFMAWIIVAVLLVLLAGYSRRMAVGLGVGLFVTALIMVYVDTSRQTHGTGASHADH